MSAEGDPSTEKIGMFVEWMKGDHVFVHLDARAEDVQVPEHLRDNPGLKLKLSYSFQGETTHDEKAISVYLKFDGHYQLCVLPWSAIWGMTNSEGETCLWTGELPPELAHLANIPPVVPAGKAEKRPPALSLVEKAGGTAKKKPELRRIK